MGDYLRRQRIAEEVLLLALHFGEVEFDELAGQWVMLPHFPVSPRLGRVSSALLIKLPGAYPAVAPFGVYVDRDLPLDAHYFPDAGDLNPLAHNGWAWLCLHTPKGASSAWRPGASIADGDNLLTLLILVRALLDAPGTGALSADQRRSIDALARDARPAILCAYGEPSALRVAGLGGVFDLDTADLALPMLVERLRAAALRQAADSGPQPHVLGKDLHRRTDPFAIP